MPVQYSVADCLCAFDLEEMLKKIKINSVLYHSSLKTGCLR